MGCPIATVVDEREGYFLEELPLTFLRFAEQRHPLTNYWVPDFNMSFTLQIKWGGREGLQGVLFPVAYATLWEAGVSYFRF